MRPWYRGVMSWVLGALLASGLLGMVRNVTVAQGQPVLQAKAAATVRYVAAGGNCGGQTPCYATVQAAVNAASAGDEIRIARGVYTENVVIPVSLVLRGGYVITDWTVSQPETYPTVIDGGNQGTVIRATVDGLSLTLEGLEITRGSASGVWVERAWKVSIRRCYVHHNVATASRGSGIDLQGGGSKGLIIDLEDNRVEYNVGKYWGSGGVRVENFATLDMRRNWVRFNQGSDNKSCRVNPCEGGGLWVRTGVTATLIGNRFEGNLGRDRVYGAYVGATVERVSACVVQDNEIRQNQVNYIAGGSFFCDFLRVKGNRVWGNQSRTDYGGGALSVYGKDVLVEGNWITGNVATSPDPLAGALSVGGDQVVVRNNVISGNVTSSGVYLWQPSRFENNVVANNRGSGVILGTPSSNGRCTAPWKYVMTHNTLVNNAGAAVYVPKTWTATCPAMVDVVNTIVVSHAIGLQTYDTGGWITATHAILSNTQNASGHVILASVMVTDPLLAPDGVHLLAGSPAVNAGTGGYFLAYRDMDGEPRTMGPFTDIGADEYPYTTSVRLAKAYGGSTPPVPLGQALTYTLNVTNVATGGWAADVRVTDEVTTEAPLSSITATVPGGSCQVKGWTVVCDVYNLGAGSHRTATVVLETRGGLTATVARGYLSGSGLGLAIVDDGCGSNQYTEHSVVVDTPVAVQDVDVWVRELTHTYDSDLNIYLRGPDGTQIELSTGNGGGGSDYLNTVFDDEASQSILNGGAPFSGRYRPEQALGAFDGKSAQGNWTLRVCDGVGGDVGRLNSWGITLTVTGPDLQPHRWVVTDTARLQVLDAVDVEGGDNQAGPVTTTIAYVPPRPDLWMQSGGTVYAQPGQTLVYTLAWGNQGTLAAADVVLTATLPPANKYLFVNATGNPTRTGQMLTWKPGQASPGAGGLYTITGRVLDTVADGTVLTTTAVITTSSPGDPGMNNRTAITTVIGTVDLNVIKAADRAKAAIGDEVQFTVWIENLGDGMVHPTMTDLLPAALEYVAGSATASQGTVRVQQGEVLWEGVLLPGRKVAVSFKAKVVSCEGVTCGVVQNTAEVRVAGVKHTWKATETLKVLCPALNIQAQVPRLVYLYSDGRVDRYEAVVRYENASTPYATVAYSPVVTLLLSNEARFMAANPLPSSKASPTRWVWNLAQLPPGSSGQIRVEIEPQQWTGAYLLISAIAPQPLAECDLNDNVHQARTYPFQVILQKGARPLKMVVSSQGLRAEQEYVVRYRYETTDPARPAMQYQLVDGWPQVYLFRGAHTSANLEVRRARELVMQSRRPMYPGDSEWVALRGEASVTSLAPGKAITNRVQISASLGSALPGVRVITESAEVATTIPLFAPRVVYPASGEMCAGKVEIVGQAQPNVKVGIAGDYPQVPPPLGKGWWAAKVSVAAVMKTARIPARRT